MIRVAILTMSDKGSRGEREDKTGHVLREYIETKENYKVKYYRMLPDDYSSIVRELELIADADMADLIITNGGTGFSTRDVTPEATTTACERMAPGVAEYMRMKSLEITPKAMLSRGVCGIRKGTLIVNLPGSPKGALENLSFVIDTLVHGIEILKGSASECAEPMTQPIK
ncbi:MogA/MoaB family molybdenum cofactor biosynthesis protein [Cetobacterium sp. SF1]|uniref:MogA/MoaB family molybdenum cofactor biosynthesis protein n=1 Tax=unclassified Cetobacterium TaxID=2630983 RepID=UPI003CF36D8B